MEVQLKLHLVRAMQGDGHAVPLVQRHLVSLAEGGESILQVRIAIQNSETKLKGGDKVDFKPDWVFHLIQADHFEGDRSKFVSGHSVQVAVVVHRVPLL